MRGVILDALDILMGCPSFDALVDVVAYVPWRKVVTKIVVHPLISLLVVTTIGLMGSTTLMSIPITAIAIRLLIVVITTIPLVGIPWW